MSGDAVATISRSMSAGDEPGALDRVGGGRGRRASPCVSPGAAMRRSRMPVRSTIHASLVSTRASRSAFVTRPSGTAVPQPIERDGEGRSRDAQPRDGWPARRRSPGCASMPISVPPNGLRTGHRVPGPFDDADLVAGAELAPFGDAVRAEDADDGRDDHPLGHGRASRRPAAIGGAVGSAGVRAGGTVTMRVPPRGWSRSDGVAQESTGTSGTVRLATPAIIEPWPTSTNASAPSAASVSIDVRQRTGTVTCSAERARQPSPSASGVRGAVVVRRRRARSAPRTCTSRERGGEPVARATP